MNVILLVGLTDVAIAILIAAVSLPLIRRKVKMNPFYGVRFQTSFKNDENWYAINEYGGRALLFASIPIAVYGLIGVIFHKTLPGWYLWTSTPVIVGCLLIAVVVSYKKAKEIDEQNAANKPGEGTA